MIRRTNNAGLLVDQKIRTRDMYHTVDKAIRHTMSTISSADGHCQQRKLIEKWEKSREQAVFPNAFCMCPNRKWKRGERWVSGGIWDSNLMMSKWEDHWEPRQLTRNPPKESRLFSPYDILCAEASASSALLVTTKNSQRHLQVLKTSLLQPLS